MIALHLDNILFLLFVAIAIFFQILTRAATKARRRPGDTTPRPTPSSQSSRPLTNDSTENDEERIRKFLEALGQPTTSKPPEPIRPRPSYEKPVVLPHIPPLKSPLPPLTTRPADLPHETRLPQQIPPTREAKIFRPKVAEAPRFEVHEGPPPLEPLPVIQTAAEAYRAVTQAAPKSVEAKINVATILRSTSGLRDAIILREIFGPPRSLQPLELVGV